MTDHDEDTPTGGKPVRSRPAAAPGTPDTASGEATPVASAGATPPPARPSAPPRAPDKAPEGILAGPTPAPRRTAPMAEGLFAVTRKHGPRWRNGQAIEDQDQYAEHAKFMADLHRAGIVMYAGPLDGVDEVLVIVRGTDAGAVRASLETDPWAKGLILLISRIRAWSLQVGAPE